MVSDGKTGNISCDIVTAEIETEPFMENMILLKN